MTLREEIEQAIQTLVESRIIAYHGTSSKFARSILKQGFIPNPKTKVWDAGYMRSYGGTYFTIDYGTAYFAAQDATRAVGGNVVIFEVQIETRTALPDEDDLKSPLKLLEILLSGDVSKQSFDKQGLKDRDLIAGTWEIFKDDILDRVVVGKVSDKELEVIHPLFKDWMQTALSIIRSSDESRFSSELEDPSLRAGKSKIMAKLKWLVSRTLQSPDAIGTLRIVEPITFRGANRILSAVELIMPATWPPTKDDPAIIHPIYGKISSKFLSEIKTRIGKIYKIE